jgi:hypothetical protein
MLRSREVTRKYLMYGVSAFVVGVGIEVLVRRVADGLLSGVGPLDIAMTVSAAVLRFARKYRGLPGLDDLGMMKIREEMSPSDFNDRYKVPIALRNPGERKAQP